MLAFSFYHEGTARRGGGVPYTSHSKALLDPPHNFSVFPLPGVNGGTSGVKPVLERGGNGPCTEVLGVPGGVNGSPTLSKAVRTLRGTHARMANVEVPPAVLLQCPLRSDATVEPAE